MDKLWIKDDFLDIHTSSVHPLHTHSFSLPFSLSVLPSVESSLPLSVSLCVRKETAASYCTCPGLSGHRKEQNSPLEHFSIGGSVCDGATLQSYKVIWQLGRAHSWGKIHFEDICGPYITPQRIHRDLATKVSAVVYSWAIWHMIGKCKSPNHEFSEASTTTDTTGRSAAMH